MKKQKGGGGAEANVERSRKGKFWKSIPRILFLNVFLNTFLLKIFNFCTLTGHAGTTSF